MQVAPITKHRKCQRAAESEADLILIASWSPLSGVASGVIIAKTGRSTCCNLVEVIARIQMLVVVIPEQ